MESRKFIATSMREYLNEQVSIETLRDMKAFGLSKSNIDSDGYVALYHAGKELPERLNADEIFFMTSSYDEALDYAKMRKGEVFEIKVRPKDVNWNQGSYEVEFDKGGLIRNGKIIPKITEKKYSLNKYIDIKNSYFGYSTISDEIFKWVERTLNYYIQQKKMLPNDAYDKIVEDIEYFYYMDEEDGDFIEFSKTLKYDNFNKLYGDLSELNNISFDECFYEI
jgi:hypothetical protein